VKLIELTEGDNWDWSFAYYSQNLEFHIGYIIAFVDLLVPPWRINQTSRVAFKAQEIEINLGKVSLTKVPIISYVIVISV